MPVDVLDPVVGDPMAVSAAGRTLESIALDVANIAGRLRALAAGDESWTGAAAVSAHVRTASLPPTLDKADASYAAAGSALGSYARTLADAQNQSISAIAAAGRASAELATAVAAHAAAASRDVAASATALSAGLPRPPATAPRYEASIDEATSQLRRAVAANDDAHEQQRQAARTAAAALQEASHAGIHNQSWFHHVTQTVGHWASTHWTATLREVSKIGTVVSALAGAAALILAVAGVAFPPLEAAAAALETVSLVSAVAAGMADTALAATGKGSWTSVGIDALTLAPAGLGKLVTKAAPMIRESRLIRPSTVVHASNGDAGRAMRELQGSGLAYPGGLGANDALGGHVLAHVGVGDDGLAARGVAEASTFTDRATAEQALADLQSANGREIRVWLAGAKAGAKFRFAATFDGPVGRILFAGSGQSVDGTTAVAVLRAHPSAPLGYYMFDGICCTVKRRYFAVQELFLSYFHPDWQLDADSRLEVAMDFVDTADPILIDQVIEELRELVQEPMADDEFHQTIDEDYSLYYDPSHENVTMRAWLIGLLQELESSRDQAASLAATRTADARER